MRPSEGRRGHRRAGGDVGGQVGLLEGRQAFP